MSTSHPRRRRRRWRGHRRGPHLVGHRRGRLRRPHPQGPPVPYPLPAAVRVAVVVARRRDAAARAPDAPPTPTRGGADWGSERTHEDDDQEEPSEDSPNHGHGSCWR
jgi:hypothetical protein